MGSVEVSKALDAEASEAADELISDTLEDGSSSTNDEEIMDGAVIRVELSEDGDGLLDAELVEGTRSPICDDGEGVDDELDTKEDSAEGDSVGAGAPCEDEGPRMADSGVEDSSAEAVIEASSSWADDVDQEGSELDIPDGEAVMLGVVVSLALILESVDSAGWTDFEADKPPSSPSPSTNTIQNL